jgi:hypothetical protein
MSARLLLLVSLAVAAIAVTLAAAHRTTASSQTEGDYAAFARQWSRQGFTVTIAADGSGSADWRTYRWCSDDPTPPCDRIADDGQITSGGHATLMATRVDGTTLFGEVVDTTDQWTLNAGPFNLKVQPYDLALLSQGERGFIFCGPDFATLAPPDVQQRTFCGLYASFWWFPCGGDMRA